VHRNLGKRNQELGLISVRAGMTEGHICGSAGGAKPVAVWVAAGCDSIKSSPYSPAAKPKRAAAHRRARLRTQACARRALRNPPARTPSSTQPVIVASAIFMKPCAQTWDNRRRPSSAGSNSKHTPCVGKPAA